LKKACSIRAKSPAQRKEAPPPVSTESTIAANTSNPSESSLSLQKNSSNNHAQVSSSENLQRK